MKKVNAFTLIEILVVATIIIVLTSISIASFSIANKSARDAKRKSDMETIRQAMVLYKTQVGSYPNANNFTVITNTLIPGYLSQPAPADPGTTDYVGNSSSTSSTFCVCADVELDKGNSGANCSFSGATHYCVKQP